jgi:hypothetical protein
MPIYDRLTEGFDTNDLLAATACWIGWHKLRFLECQFLAQWRHSGDSMPTAAIHPSSSFNRSPGW